MPAPIVGNLYPIHMDGKQVFLKKKKPPRESGLYVRDLETGRAFCEICNKPVPVVQGNNNLDPAHCPSCNTCCIVCDDSLIRCRRLIGDEPWSE